jgi:hypothetical protein
MAVNINHEGFDRRMSVVKDILKAKGLTVSVIHIR